MRVRISPRTDTSIIRQQVFGDPRIYMPNFRLTDEVHDWLMDNVSKREPIIPEYQDFKIPTRWPVCLTFLPWSFNVTSRGEYFMVIQDPKKALLFKLAWGGSI